MNYQVMPSLTSVEFEGLKDDIARHGVLVPVEMDEQGNILDGHHRIRAWQELREEGVTLPDYPRMIRSGMSEEAKRNHARRLNVMRRQLTREQRDDVMRAMRADGMSQRQIAKAVGVHRKTVSNVLALAGGENSPPANITGEDGKTYPAERGPLEQRNEIIRAMRADGMSQTQIAREVGVAQRTVSNVLALPGGPFGPPGEITEDDDEPYPVEQRPTPTPPPSLFVPGGAVQLDPVAAGAVEERVKPHVANNSGNNEWYTPAEYVDAARRVLGTIDLDPASSETANAVVGAARFFTDEDDGLAQSWSGRVWMNPPYAAELVGRFAEKMATHYEAGDVEQAIILVNNATETAWFQRMARTATSICFPKGRVRFWQPSGVLGTPLQGQALIYMGKHTTQFAEVFGDFGIVVSL